MARIYQSTSMGEADIRVAIVHERATADLLVYRVSSYGQAFGDALWLITKDKQSATAWIFFTSPGMAEVKVCFVDSQSEAGWKAPHRFQGRFG